VRGWRHAGPCSCVCCRAAWRPPANPWDTLLPRGVGHVGDGRAFAWVHGLPSPRSADGWPPVFAGVIGTRTGSDASGTAMEAGRPGAFASRSGRGARADISEVSWFSCRTLLDVPGVFADAGSERGSRWRPPPCGLPLQSSRVGTPMAAFRRARAQPADTPTHASAVTSRRPPQDLGSGWLARPFL
jgi:hypothetical protein